MMKKIFFLLFLLTVISNLYAQKELVDIPYLESNDLNRDTEYFWEKEFEEDKPLSLTQNKSFYKTLIFIDEKNATISENFPIEDISLSKEETQHLDLRNSRFRYKTDHQ